MRASYSPQSELSACLEICAAFRRCDPLSCALYAACSPGDSGHTDLALPVPSSVLSTAVPFECPSPGGLSSNKGRGSRSLPDLTGHLTARADAGHAPPLSASAKIVSLSVILLSPLVRFPALNPIKPQHPPLVVLPRQFL